MLNLFVLIGFTTYPQHHLLSKEGGEDLSQIDSSVLQQMMTLTQPEVFVVVVVVVVVVAVGCWLLVDC